ncbi:hypothetical protein CWM52_03820 [Raoultella sp. T31]|nr:hypothetical protein CWM52_03820 [Raoultella sp. T31]
MANRNLRGLSLDREGGDSYNRLHDHCSALIFVKASPRRYTTSFGMCQNGKRMNPRRLLR